eukprot:25621-Amphidinium_carterae.1
MRMCFQRCEGSPRNGGGVVPLAATASLGASPGGHVAYQALQDLPAKTTPIDAVPRVLLLDLGRSTTGVVCLNQFASLAHISD